jgi:CubicO group peptidase (beta-lactamase class C family)
MLWLRGQKDMGSYAAAHLFAPGTSEARFRYSSGNAVILMRALKEVYGKLYDTLPFDVLFKQLGMNSVAFERDRTGTFVGSSYAHMSLADMARFGYAYVNGGWYDGRQVIDPEFVLKARLAGKGSLASGTIDQDFLDEAAFYTLGFWSNSDFHLLPKKFGPQFPQFLGDMPNGLEPGDLFFPGVTTDVFFAAGHYGQNILVFPREDLVVVRMSHDKEYFSKLDTMMKTAIACFVPEAAQ